MCMCTRAHKIRKENFLVGIKSENRVRNDYLFEIIPRYNAENRWQHSIMQEKWSLSVYCLLESK